MIGVATQRSTMEVLVDAGLDTPATTITAVAVSPAIPSSRCRGAAAISLPGRIRSVSGGVVADEIRFDDLDRIWHADGTQRGAET